MTTLSIMKARINSELARGDDLDDEIANAINDAIAIYQTKRFYFNEARGPIVTFTTIAGTNQYGVSDNANIPSMMSFDYVCIEVGGKTRFLDRRTPEEIEDLLGNTSAAGEPYAWTYYDALIRLYPTPTDAWTVRFPGHVKRAAPASDSETGNYWMVEAERMIRSRAKRELAVHVLRDAEMAAAMMAEAIDAESILTGQTARKNATGIIEPTQF